MSVDFDVRRQQRIPIQITMLTGTSCFSINNYNVDVKCELSVVTVFLLLSRLQMTSWPRWQEASQTMAAGAAWEGQIQRIIRDLHGTDVRWPSRERQSYCLESKKRHGGPWWSTCNCDSLGVGFQHGGKRNAKQERPACQSSSLMYAVSVSEVDERHVE